MSITKGLSVRTKRGIYFKYLRRKLYNSADLHGLLYFLKQFCPGFHHWKQTELWITNVSWATAERMRESHKQQRGGMRNLKRHECKMRPHLGGVGVPIRSTHGAGLQHWAEPTFPMSACFQPALVARAAFSGFYTETDRSKGEKDVTQNQIWILKSFRYTREQKQQQLFQKTLTSRPFST